MAESTPFIEYEQEDGAAIYYHERRDETIIGSELGETENPDAWVMRWYCPRCGDRNPPEDELSPAGMTSIHVPCATEDELDLAEVQEQRVAVNLRNAKAFEDGAFDNTGVRE